MIYISHLDMQRMFQRAFRRANIALEFSQGFNPHPKMTYSPPLPLFTSSDEEYIDVAASCAFGAAALQKALPDGIIVNSVRPLTEEDVPLSEKISTAVYEIVLYAENPEEACAALTAACKESGSLMAEKRDKKRRMIQKDIRPLIKSADFRISDNCVVCLCELSLKNDTLLNPHIFISVLMMKASVDEKKCVVTVKKIKTLSDGQ